MMTSEIKGQDIPKRLLSSMTKKQTIPSALLFYGPPGVGKFSLALDFAGEIIGDKDLVKRGVHPDSINIFPEFSEYDSGKIFRIRRAGEYYKLRYFKASISIDRIREIQHYAYLTPMKSDWKTITILQAENMTVNASDAFLKILEEPPKNVLFILITLNPHLLTETIFSRTLGIRFHPLSPDIQKDIIGDPNLRYFGRGIEDTLLLKKIKDMEDELEKIFFHTERKVRIKDWNESLVKKWRIEFLLIYLWKMVEDKYYNGKIDSDRAYKIFSYLKKAYEYYYSNIAAEKILFYLFLKI